MTNPETRLRAFQAENNIFTKGPLSLVIQFTRLVRDQTFPLNPDDFQTSGKGQVAGLGGGNLKKILKEHGITQQLSAEGGRTSRGSMGLMIKYVDFLNAWNIEETVDFTEVEDFWAEQVREYFRNQPFILTADTSKTIGANLDDLFEQARKRQKQNPGTQYLGTVLQHLVAAKLYLRHTGELYGQRQALGRNVGNAKHHRGHHHAWACGVSGGRMAACGYHREGGYHDGDADPARGRVAHGHRRRQPDAIPQPHRKVRLEPQKTALQKDWI